MFRNRLQQRLAKLMADTDEEVLGEIDNILLEEKDLTLRQRLELQSELYDAVRKLDLVEELLQMPGVNEIMINGYDQIYIEENGQLGKKLCLPGTSGRCDPADRVRVQPGDQYQHASGGCQTCGWYENPCGAASGGGRRACADDPAIFKESH